MPPPCDEDPHKAAEAIYLASVKVEKNVQQVGLKKSCDDVPGLKQSGVLRRESFLTLYQDDYFSENSRSLTSLVAEVPPLDLAAWPPVKGRSTRTFRSTLSYDLGATYGELQDCKNDEQQDI